MGPIEEADQIPTTEDILVQVPRAEHQEEIEHQLEEMNPNRNGIEGPLIAEPEANHGESVRPSNDAQIAPSTAATTLISNEHSSQVGEGVRSTSSPPTNPETTRTSPQSPPVPTESRAFPEVDHLSLKTPSSLT